jgi:hypothetical protein
METVRLSAHTTAEGRLLLDLPTSLEDSDVEVTITVEPRGDHTRDELGWPIGFWNQFAGSMPDFPEIDDGPPEEVEPLR